jgi:hypothetical protein
MNDKRREILIGYLLGTLEPQEFAKVDAEMQNNEDLHNDLAVLYREISLMNEIADHCDPPDGLAARTCRNLWAKIDSSQSSQITNALHLNQTGRKKRKITVVVSQNDQQQDEFSDTHPPHSTSPTPHTNLISSEESQELNPVETIPLSQALLLAPQGKPRKPSKILRRVDHEEKTPAEPHLLIADSLIIAKKHPPKHYGRKSKDTEAKIKRPWTTRDVFASLLVGLTAAVLIFPLIQLGINTVGEMIKQQKIQNVANSMSPTTSQYSLSSLSPNSARMITSMNIDSQTASALHSQRQNTPAPFADAQNSSPPTIHPVHSAIPNLPVGGGDAP